MHHKRRPFQIALLLAFLILASSGLAPRPASAALLPTLLNPLLKIHPLLLVGAQSEPDRTIRVLVRRSDNPASKLGILRGILANNVEQFDFVNTVAMDISLKTVLALALNPDVLYISPDAMLNRHGTPPDPTRLETLYPGGADVERTWTDPSIGATGAGVTVAVLDTGFSPHPDLPAGRLQTIVTNPKATTAADGYGHGTHIAGIVAGRSADGAHVGVAPDATLLGVKIADDNGVASASDLLRGLKWVHDNRVARTIRVVSLSVTVGTPESYLTSPVAAAVERLWFDGVVVVVAAGNDGTARDAVWYAPANDPYVITVGCLDDNETKGTADDGLCFFSSRGKTQDGFAKPEVVAPGRKLVSTLAAGSAFARDYPDRIVDQTYIRMSGTSMSAPVVAGSVALLLERHPKLTPDQVKWLLTATDRPYAGQPDGAGVTDAHAAMRAAGGALGRANQGLKPSRGALLAPLGLVTGLVGDLTSLVVDQTYFETGRWRTAYFETGRWRASEWNTGRWRESVYD